MSDKSAPNKPMKIATLLEHLLAYIQRQWRLLALVALYIFFRSTFEGKIASLLESFEPSLGSFVIWLFLIVIALVYTYVLIRRRYVLSEGLCAWTVVMFAGWAYYRFVGATHYVVTPTLQVPWACYIDLFLVLCVCIALVVGCSDWMRRKSKKEVADNSKEGFHVELPRTSEDEDLLGRRKEAETLAEKIFQTDTSPGAFTLGLTAPWGAGKTSFMLVMKEYLERQHNEKTIVIEFNPWRYRKAPNLTQIFFEELSRALAPYNSALSSGFVRYVDLLLAKDSNPWLQLASRFLPHESNAKSTGEQYDCLTREIGKLGRKIFIFIDDVDRLEREELVELFALVRNSSSFPYMSYILVYDKEYVASQLKGCFDQHTHRYLEKIVQVEYALAQITPEQLEQALKMELEEIGYGDLWETLEESRIQISYHLPTIRAVKRICNTLSSRRKELERNVILFDWFILELIRTQYPDLFEFLKNSYEQSFYFSADSVYISCEMGGPQKSFCKSDDSSSLTKIESAQKFYRYLQEHDVDFQWRDAQQAFALMNFLWGEDREVGPLQINHRLYIGRYFYGVLRTIEVSEEEFRLNISLPFNKMYIKEKLDKGQLRDFAHKLLRDKDRINSAEIAEKYLRIALYIDTIGYSEVLFREGEISSFIESLKSYWDNGKACLQEKLKEILSDPDLKLGVILYLSMVNNLHVSSQVDTYEDLEEMHLIMQIFDWSELIKLMEERFWECVEEMRYDPVKCYLLWRECLIYEEDERGNQIFYRPSPHQLIHVHEWMKKIIEKNVEKLIPYFIQYNPRSSSLFELLLPEPIWNLDKRESNSLTSYFPDFISDLDNASSSSVIKEFRAFLTKWGSREEELDKLVPGMPSEMRKKELQYISFNFKHIQPVGIIPIIQRRKYL